MSSFANLDNQDHTSPPPSGVPLYPAAIVWSPLPPLTWLCPVIGHMGITYSNGVICDFAGPYTVNEQGRMAFGNPTRYLPIKGIDTQKWDDAVHHANGVYNKRMHNICCDNCHSHVASALNDMQLYGSKQWNMIVLSFWVFFAGRFPSFFDFVKTFGPSTFLAVIIILVKLT